MHAEWLCDVITSGDFSQYRLHTYDAKFLRNFPVSRSLVEDRRRTAFFGVSAIQCASVDLTEGEIELSSRRAFVERCRVRSDLTSQSSDLCPD